MHERALAGRALRRSHVHGDAAVRRRSATICRHDHVRGRRKGEVKTRIGAGGTRIALAVRLVALLAVPLALSGCELLFPAYGYGYGNTDPIDPTYPTAPYTFEPYLPDPTLSPVVTFRAGRATLTFTQDDTKQSILLGDIADGSGESHGMSDLTWTNADGWSLTMTSRDASTESSKLYSYVVTLKRSVTNDVWVASNADDPKQCAIN